MAIGVLSPLEVSARDLQFRLQPATDQMAAFNQGIQIVASERPGSIVQMIAPEPTNAKRIEVQFVFLNRSGQAINIGPENVVGSSFSVVTYEQLLGELRRKESWSRLGTALQMMGNSLAAQEAGRQYGSYNYTGNVYGSSGYIGSVNGGGTVSFYDPYAANQAQVLASAQNAAIGARLRQESADQRQSIDRNFRTTTLASGQAVVALLTFEVPKALRDSRSTQPFSIAVSFGSELHVLRGYTGPVGMGPPSVVTALPPSGQMLRAAAANVPSDGSIGSVSIEAFNRGEYAGNAVKIGVLAKQGYAPAQNALGVMYQGGVGVAQNNEEAARQYRLAADQALREAQSNLGWMYESGQGVKRDLERAKSYYRLAADQGDAFARARYEALTVAQAAPHSEALAHQLTSENIVNPINPVGPVPTTSPSSWISTSDYPIEALRGGITGTSEFSIQVGEDGTSRSCNIVRSSGSPILDDATCTVVAARARFRPAVGADGEPTIGVYRNRINWIIPTALRPASPLTEQADWIRSVDIPRSLLKTVRAEGTAYSLGVNTLGQVNSCNALKPSSTRALDRLVCSIAAQKATFTPATDARGLPIPSTYRLDVNWRNLGLPAAGR